MTRRDLDTSKGWLEMAEDIMVSALQTDLDVQHKSATTAIACILLAREKRHEETVADLITRQEAEVKARREYVQGGEK